MIYAVALLVLTGVGGGANPVPPPPAPLPNNLFAGMTRPAIERVLREQPRAVQAFGGIANCQVHCEYVRAGLTVLYGPDGRAVSVSRAP